MTPMKEMTIAQRAEFPRSDCSPRIKQAIANVYAEGSTREKKKDPGFKLNPRRPPKGERPRDCDGGCIKAGKMPGL
jgi:hypothetical protein